MTPVMLSGGSEIVALSLVEELSEAGYDLAVISIVGKSILRGVVPGMRYAELAWPPTHPLETATRIRDLLLGWGASQADPWLLFPTEDGGLRLVIENADAITDVARLGGARRLRLGGLDKGELFEFLHGAGCEGVIAPTVVVRGISEVSRAIEELGGDVVIKPSLKPLSMRLAGMRAKAFTSAQFGSQQQLLDALAGAWGCSNTWVVQERLSTPEIGEPVVWAVRDQEGQTTGMCAVERWKQPRYGGTGCWVTTHNASEAALLPVAKKILDALDFVGICELPFLLDRAGAWRLLELNPRAWLQVGLGRAAGVPFACDAVRVMDGGSVERRRARNGVSWVNPERLIVAALSGDQGHRAGAFTTALRAWRSADCVPVYGSVLPHVKRRWLARLTTKALPARHP